MKIRTVTVGIPDAFSREQLRFAVDFSRRCQSHFEANGYEVQTTRIISQAWEQIPNVDRALELDGRIIFAATMNCPPNTPFFPAGYWQDEGFNLGIGWQAADLVHEAFAEAPDIEVASARLKTLMEHEGH